MIKERKTNKEVKLKTDDLKELKKITLEKQRLNLERELEKVKEMEQELNSPTTTNDVLTLFEDGKKQYHKKEVWR